MATILPVPLFTSSTPKRWLSLSSAFRCLGGRRIYVSSRRRYQAHRTYYPPPLIVNTRPKGRLQARTRDRYTWLTSYALRRLSFPSSSWRRQYKPSSIPFKVSTAGNAGVCAGVDIRHTRTYPASKNGLYLAERASTGADEVHPMTSYGLRIPREILTPGGRRRRVVDTVRVHTQ